METKVCSNCNQEVDINKFYKQCGKPQSRCKECIKQKRKEYRNSEHYKNYFDSYYKEYQEQNKEKLKDYKKQHYLKNKDKIIKKSKKYYEDNKIECNKKNSENSKKNREKINERNRVRNKNKRESDPLFRLSNNIRGLIYNSIKRMGYKKESNTYNILGCSYEQFIFHLENKFEPWMNWDNYGLYNGEFSYGWDIDHIIPVSSVRTEEDIININHYTNLQPLCSKINRDIKKDKLIYEI